MPAPRHLRHLPATLSLSAYHPRPHPNFSAYSTRSPRSTGSPYSTATYAPHHTLPPPLHTLPLYMYLAPISCRTFSPSPQQPSPNPSVQLPTPRPHTLTPSSAPRSYLSILLPTPLPCTLRSPFCRKVCTPPPKASSNPPVEIFCSKGRRRLILNILPRRHHVDNSVNSHVHSE